MPRDLLDARLSGRRIIVTGAARSIGAALARRLHRGGARVALLGLEPELLEQVAVACGRAPWRYCDVRDAGAVETAIGELVAELGGLDVVVANAGVGAQLPMIGGDTEVMRQTVDVNLMGTYHTLRAAGEHLGHPGGYALIVTSGAAAVHLPLIGAYSATAAAVEALGNTLRVEMRHLGARVGVGYLGEIDTEMISIGFDSAAADKIRWSGMFTAVSPLETAVSALERGIVLRRRRIYAPGWVAGLVHLRVPAQRVIDLRRQPRMAAALSIARTERARFTTDLPERTR
ncbi:SDR family NAD(P)-dependent oxidoreductase [Rhodococcus sp. NPDC058505]|uniref:SDR family NAD(P)-dependent oxidoreductase n=1 Tax=unclassified Rhodococcus (in: high G+C Gram-positive bacteria) TaxID=192944 RepID=UPI003653C45B